MAVSFIYSPPYNLLTVESTVDVLSTKIGSMNNNKVVEGASAAGVDMEALRKEFACKSPPDYTIVRLE
jgi:hypothetical protein